MNWICFLCIQCASTKLSTQYQCTFAADMRRRWQLSFNICSSPTSMPLNNFLSPAILLQYNNISNSIKQGNKNIIIKYGWSGAHSYLFVLFSRVVGFNAMFGIDKFVAVCVLANVLFHLTYVSILERSNQFFVSASPLQFALFIWKASIDLKMRCLNNTSTVIGYFETMAHRQHSTKQYSSRDK